VIIPQGGAFGGWALYTKDGKPTYCHNLLGLQRFKVKADKPVPPGTDGIRTTRGGPAKAAGTASTSTATIWARKAPGDCATDLLRG
jgi:hypothetical protein